jgi:hypothetical protein
MKVPVDQDRAALRDVEQLVDRSWSSCETSTRWGHTAASGALERGERVVIGRPGGAARWSRG